MKKTVSIEERQWIKNNAIKMVGAKNGLEIPVMDTQKIVARIKAQFKDGNSPYITILPISADQHKTPHKSFPYVKDPNTGVYYGIMLQMNEYGNPRWQKVNISDSLTLDMSKEADILQWAVLRFHEEILGSPFQKSSPYYKVKNPMDEAKARIERGGNVKLAMERVLKIEDKVEESVRFLRFMGVELMENSSIDIIKGELTNKALESPEEFIKKWDAKSRSIGELFFSAKAIGVITTEPEYGFMFGGVSLGMSKVDAIKRLASDHNLATSVQDSLRSEDKLVALLTEEYKKSKSSTPSDDSPDDDDETL